MPPASERLDHLVGLGRARLLDRFRPQRHAAIAVFAIFADILVVADIFLKLLDERLGGVGRQRIDERGGDDDPVAFIGAEFRLLAADAVGRRGERQVLLADRRLELAIEGDMRAADQHRPDDVRLRDLDARDGRSEIGDVEREELGPDILAARFAQQLLHPFRGDLAVIVVGGQDVALLQPLLLDDVVDKRLELLRRHHAGVDMTAIADAALVERVVEEQAFVLVARSAASPRARNW